MVNDQFIPTDANLRHHLRETLVLLGCRVDVANLLEKSLDAEPTQADMHLVENYNIELFASMKLRLANLTKLKLRIAETGKSESI